MSTQERKEFPSKGGIMNKNKKLLLHFLPVLRKLQSNLNKGEYCFQLSCCPLYISHNLQYDKLWECYDCHRMFRHISPKIGRQCPCRILGKKAITELDNIIKELEQWKEKKYGKNNCRK